MKHCIYCIAILLFFMASCDMPYKKEDVLISDQKISMFKDWEAIFTNSTSHEISDTFNFKNDHVKVIANIIQSNGSTYVTDIKVFNNGPASITVKSSIDTVPLNTSEKNLFSMAVGGNLEFSTDNGKEYTTRIYYIYSSGKILKDIAMTPELVQTKLVVGSLSFDSIVSAIKTNGLYLEAKKNTNRKTSQAAINYILKDSQLMDFLNSLDEPSKHRLADYINALQEIGRVLNEANPKSIDIQNAGSRLKKESDKFVNGQNPIAKNLAENANTLGCLVADITIPVAN